MENRKVKLAQWTKKQLAELHGLSAMEVSLRDLSGDASFRRYFRVELPASCSTPSYIVVDAPPETEKNPSFVRIAKAFREANVSTPEVLRVDYEQGFMLQEDFGDELYLHAMRAGFDQPEATDRLYKLAIDALVRLQAGVSPEGFEAYDRSLLRREMQLFPDWFCERYLGMVLDDEDKQQLEACMLFLEEQALAQPQVVVHRDYHSRNLMIPDARRFGAEKIPGVIDFQDAVVGAYTYDLASLLRDYYISWPLAYVQDLGLYYREQAEQAGIIAGIDTQHFFRDMDLMGLQRNLKVIGIFARLGMRDLKPQFLADIPQAIQYLLDVAPHYPELEAFLNWFNQRVLPLARDKLSSGTLCAQ